MLSSDNSSYCCQVTVAMLSNSIDDHVVNGLIIGWYCSVADNLVQSVMEFCGFVL